MIYYGLFQISNLMAPFLLYPFITRLLSPSDVSNYFVIYAILQLAFIITDYGYSIRMVAILGKLAVSEQASYVFLSIVIRGTLAIIASFLAVLYLNSNIYPSTSILILISASIIFQSINMNWYFHGHQDYRSLFKYALFGKFVYITLTIVLILISPGLINVIIGLLVGSALQVLLHLRRINVDLGLNAAGVTIAALKAETLSGLGYFLSKIITAPYTLGCVLILGYFRLDATLYAMFEQVYRGVQLFGMTMIQTIYPRIANTGNLNSAKKIIPYTIIFITCVLCFYFVGPFFMSVIFNQNVSLNSEIYIAFILLMLINFFGVFFGYPVLSIFRKHDMVNLTVLPGLAVFVFALIYLSSAGVISDVALVYSVIATELTVLVVRLGMVFYWSGRYAKSVCKK